MTSFDENGIGDLLHAASTDAPPSRVDLAAVLRDGHRRRVRRVALPVLAAATVALVTAGVLATVTWPRGHAAPPANPTPSVSVPTVFPLDRVRVEMTDSLGLPMTGVYLTTYGQHLQFGDPLGNGIGVWVYVPGFEDGWRSDPAYELVQAPSVGGRAASYVWVAGDGGDPDRLVAITIEWAAGAWATITYSPPGDDEAVLLSLAESLRTNVDTPAQVGFTVSPPPGLRWVESQPWALGADAPAQLTSVWFDFGETPLPPSQPIADGPRVMVRVDFADEVWASEGEPMMPNTTVGGHPAWVLDGTAELSPGYDVCLLDEGAPAVCVSVHGEGAVDRFDPAQANDLALSVQVLGSWTDRSQWTDAPIRVGA